MGAWLTLWHHVPPPNKLAIITPNLVTLGQTTWGR